MHAACIPGGTNDRLARMIGTHLTDKWGKTVMVDNRPGADGVIATDTVSKASPDGYTLIILVHHQFMALAGFQSRPSAGDIPVGVCLAHAHQNVSILKHLESRAAHRTRDCPKSNGIGRSDQGSAANDPSALEHSARDAL